jgi:hypothetical protein
MPEFLCFPGPACKPISEAAVVQPERPGSSSLRRQPILCVAVACASVPGYSRRMSVAKSKETERSLHDLFSGKPALRERALLAVDAKDREKVRHVAKVRQNAKLLVDVMLSDLGHASGSMHKDFSSQFWRRSAIRALAAAVDGIIFALKQVALASAQLTGRPLTDADAEFLAEKSSLPSGKVRMPPFRDHFKHAFKLFAKAHGTTCPTDFGVKGFDALCQTFELRHRVTHPKSFMTFRVDDNETKRAGVAIDWLYRELTQLLETSHSALGPKLTGPA